MLYLSIQGVITVKIRVGEIQIKYSNTARIANDVRCHSLMSLWLSWLLKGSPRAIFKIFKSCSNCKNWKNNKIINCPQEIQNVQKWYHTYLFLIQTGHVFDLRNYFWAALYQSLHQGPSISSIFNMGFCVHTKQILSNMMESSEKFSSC